MNQSEQKLIFVLWIFQDLKGRGLITWTELVINVVDSDDQHVNFSRGFYEATIDKESQPVGILTPSFLLVFLSVFLTISLTQRS